MQELKLRDDLLALIETEQKRITVRRGHRDILPGELVFSGVNDENHTVKVNVSRVTHKTLAEISFTEAHYEGAQSVRHLQEGMLEHYPDLQLDDEVTVILFKYLKN